MTIALFAGLLLFGCSKSPEQLKSEFFTAVKQDNYLKVSSLIKEGVNVNQPETQGGWSALHFAAQLGSEEMVKALLAAGANPNYIGTAPGQEGTVIGLKPLPLAQACVGLAESIQSNPSLTITFPNPLVAERLKDPKALDRYKRVCSILDQVTSDNDTTTSPKTGSAVTVTGVSSNSMLIHMR